MAGQVKPIPDGYQGATPYLCCKDAAGAIEFYKKAFGATEMMRLPEPSGKVGHAEIKIGQAIVMLADEYPDMGVVGPQSLGGSPVSIVVYVEDVDKLVSQAEAARAKVATAPKDEFYGDRVSKLTDPYGHVWMFATHKEDVTPEEMQKRYEAMMQKG